MNGWNVECKTEIVERRSVTLSFYILNSTVSILLLSGPASANPVGDIVARASPAVVKLYGAAAGREHGYGTGVLVSPDGKILTALSLMVTGSNPRVILADGRRFEGRLVRMDDARQLALLQIDADNLPYLTPAPAVELREGDSILAVSNYFKIAEGDESASVCRGVISAKLTSLKARRLAQDFEYSGPAIIYDAITSNPGAAGGPVLDVQGRFVGLIGKVVEATATNTRINYATPGEVLADFLGESGAAKHATTQTPVAAPSGSGKSYVGIKLSELGYRHVAAYVERVRSGSPAAKAGIQPDDLIVAIDAQRIGDAASYQKAVESLLPGQIVQFTIKRGTQVLTVSVTIGEQP